MLENEEQAALNRAIRLCQHSADMLCRAADATAEPELSATFAAIGRNRARMAQTLMGHLHNLGEQAMTPDADREFIEWAVSRIRAALAENADAVLIGERLEDEDELAAALAEAKVRNLPEPARRELDADCTVLERDRACLAAWQDRLGPTDRDAH